MILLDRYIVVNISAGGSFYRIFKNGCLRGASFSNSASKDQYKSGDSNSLA